MPNIAATESRGESLRPQWIRVAQGIEDKQHSFTRRAVVFSLSAWRLKFAGTALFLSLSMWSQVECGGTLVATGQLNGSGRIGNGKKKCWQIRQSTHLNKREIERDGDCRTKAHIKMQPQGANSVGL
jgi:hypothetical protein